MAKPAKSKTKTPQLKRLIASETDTARAAHFRRVLDGPAALQRLTGKTDLLRLQRNALIDGLPSVMPVTDETAGPNTPVSTSFTALQAQINDLHAQILRKGE